MKEPLLPALFDIFLFRCRCGMRLVLECQGFSFGSLDLSEWLSIENQVSQCFLPQDLKISIVLVRICFSIL